MLSSWRTIQHQRQGLSAPWGVVIVLLHGDEWYCMVWSPGALKVSKSQQKNDGLLEEELDQPCQVVNICHTFQLLQIVLFHINPKQIFALSSQFKIYPLYCVWLTLMLEWVPCSHSACEQIHLVNCFQWLSLHTCRFLQWQCFQRF